MIAEITCWPSLCRFAKTGWRVADALAASDTSTGALTSSLIFH